jgi:hypothetical protein
MELDADLFWGGLKVGIGQYKIFTRFHVELKNIYIGSIQPFVYVIERKHLHPIAAVVA